MKFNNCLRFMLAAMLTASITACSVGSTSTPTSGTGSNGTGGTGSNGTLTGLTISPASQNSSLGNSASFAAMGTYSDGTTQILTTVASWSSSSQSIATISKGLATPVSIGTTTITAQYSTFTAAASLSVTAAISGNNVMSVTVNGSLCSSGSYPNKPCVSVKVCKPGSTTSCQTITDLLVDTGSIGLRIFSQALNSVSLTQITSGSNSLASCVLFLDNSSFWGPVQQADVYLGGESAVTIPIQVIDSTFGKVPTGPTGCGTPDTSPTTAGMNGILGVGFLSQDCGTTCTTIANTGMYYLCSGTTCTASTASLTDQVQNPVASLATDNNGVILQLPAVAAGGVASMNGSLILGIGTQSNNSPSGVTMYPLDPTSGTLETTFNGKTCTYSFIDSGSNALYFPPSSKVNACTNVSYLGWFCPTATTSLSATIAGYNGSPSNNASFEITSAQTLLPSGNYAFSDLGGYASSSSNSATCSPSEYFDWGLPFYFGKSVYLGFEGKSSSLGTGPYNAF